MLWVELIMYFNPERNKNIIKKRKVEFELFSGSEIPRPIVAFFLRFK